MAIDPELVCDKIWCRTHIIAVPPFVLNRPFKVSDAAIFFTVRLNWQHNDVKPPTITTNQSWYHCKRIYALTIKDINLQLEYSEVNL